MGTPSFAARSLRQKQRISYYEPEEPKFDEYVYCEECNDFVYEYCAIHGPLLVIPDDKVPLKSKHPPIVPRAALTIPHVFLHLARSNIPGAGIGVFSTLTLPRGVRFGPYRGERVTGVDSAYCWQMYDGNNKPSYVIDAADASRSNWMRYVNCARGWLEQNLVAYQYQGQLYYRTIKIIPRFSELLVFYAPRIGPSAKKKPRLEPPTKETGEDTTKKTAALIDASVLVNLPTTVQENDAGCGKIDNRHKYKAEVNSIKAKSNQVVLKHKDNLDCDQNKTQPKKITEETCDKPDVKMLTSDAKPKTVTQLIGNGLNATQSFESVAIEGDNNFSTFICNDCNICSFRFTKQNHSERHISLKHDLHLKKHAGVKSYACALCSYKSNRNDHLKRHMRTHAGEKPFACNVCSFKCNRNTHLEEHMRTHTVEKRYACNTCSYTCNQNTYLKQHMRTHTGEKPYACKVCSYKCNQSNSLTRHMKTHSGEKPYACNMCSYTCNQNTYLKRHMRTHTGAQKPYACNMCSYKCNQSNSLTRHMKTHSEEKPYACNMCSYTSNQNAYLKRHMRSHTGDKPFACKVCTYKCSRSGSLKQHMRSHTEEKPYACKVCTYKFNRSSNLKRHMRTHENK